MVKLKGKKIYLRALEPEDLQFLYELENDSAIWEISGTIAPYSKHVLKQYLDNAHRDIFEVRQLRLSICSEEDKVIGFIDLFDYNPVHKRAGIGIIIQAEADRNQGAGTEATELLLDYVFSVLDLHQVFANVEEKNTASIHLFSKLGFVEVGRKIDWIRSGNEYKNEILFQKIKS